MTRDMVWRAEHHQDFLMDMYVEMHKETFKQIFRKWASSKLEHFSGQYIFADLNAQRLFHQLQELGISPTYSDCDTTHIVPLLEQATYRTDPDRRLYERHYLLFYEEYRKENEVTRKCEKYLGRYIKSWRKSSPTTTYTLF